MTNLEAFPAFFYSLLYDMVLDKKRYEFLKTCGIRPSDWPECDAKAIAIGFESRVKSKGFEYASSVVFNKSLKTRPDFELPRETNTLVAYCEDFKTYGRYTQLAEKLKRAPLSGQKTLSEFKDQSSSSVNVTTLSDALVETLQAIEADVKEKKAVIEIPNWPTLSDLIGGFNPDRVFIFTARTGIGKTSLALNLALNAIQKMPVLYFNMEMSIRDITTRCIQIGSKISAHAIRNGDYVFQQSKITSFLEGVSSGKDFFITDGRALSLEQIMSEIMRKKEEHGIGLVILDYDQKIRSKDFEEEWKALHRAMEEMEEISKAAHVPIVVLAQANDDGNPRASQRTTQVASALIHLDEIDGKYSMQAKKNRYGQRDARIEILFDKPTQHMTEVGLCLDKTESMMQVASESKRKYGYSNVR